MKDFIFTNVTSDNVQHVYDVIKDKTLIGAYIETDGTIFTPELPTMIEKYALNTILELECTEAENMNSIARLQRKVPTFEEVLDKIPDGKFLVLKKLNEISTEELARLVAITAMFEDYPVLFDSYVDCTDILDACKSIADALGMPDLRMPTLREYDHETIVIDASILEYVRSK